MEGEIFDKTVEILKNRLYFGVARISPITRLKNTRGVYYITFDTELKYRNFHKDFGPLNISCVFKYCCKMNKCLQNFEGKRRVVHYTTIQPERKVNAAYLMGCYAVICLHMTPYDIYKLLVIAEPYKQFVDALHHNTVHTIRLFDCLQAISKALTFNFFNFSDFNAAEYDLYDSFKFGNLNWVVPRKFVAFLGPTDAKTPITHSPNFYLEYFLQNDVKTVIRLNNKLYNPSVFIELGIEHYDLFFDDGGVPPKEVLMKFFRIAETAPAAIAVHCKAGLGRTGTLIGAYMMKHYRMGAREAVAWLRICRPGSVIGLQQGWLEELENWLWRAGSEYRFRHYGEGDKIPQHRYGIYSKLWPVHRMKILEEAKRRAKELKGALSDRKILTTHNPLTDRQYFRHFSKLLSTMKNLEEGAVKKVGKVLTVVPETHFTKKSLVKF